MGSRRPERPVETDSVRTRRLDPIHDDLTETLRSVGVNPDLKTIGLAAKMDYIIYLLENTPPTSIIVQDYPGRSEFNRRAGRV